MADELDATYVAAFMEARERYATTPQEPDQAVNDIQRMAFIVGCEWGAARLSEVEEAARWLLVVADALLVDIEESYTPHECVHDTFPIEGRITALRALLSPPPAERSTGGEVR